MNRYHHDYLFNIHFAYDKICRSNNRHFIILKQYRMVNDRKMCYKLTQSICYLFSVRNVGDKLGFLMFVKKEEKKKTQQSNSTEVYSFYWLRAIIVLFLYYYCLSRIVVCCLIFTTRTLVSSHIYFSH